MFAKYLFSAFICDDQSVMLLQNWQLETKKPNQCLHTLKEKNE